MPINMRLREYFWMRFFLFLSAFFSLNFAIARAEQVKSSDLIVRIIEAGPDSIDTKLEREQMVERVRRYCEFVDHEFPRNSPEEARWLEQETSAGNERFFRALASPEWGRQMVANFVAECYSYSDSFSESSTDTQREWALIMLANTFIRRHVGLEDAAKRGGIEDNKFAFFMFDRIAEKILEMGAMQVSGLSDPYMSPQAIIEE